MIDYTENNLDKIEIKCEQVSVKSNNEDNKYNTVPSGNYLEVSYSCFPSISSDKKELKRGNKTRISLLEFEKKLLETKKKNKIPKKSEPSISIGIPQPSIGEDTKNEVDYTPIIDLILKKLEIDVDNLSNETEVVIESPIQLFTELPWENISVRNNIYVIRKVAKGDRYVERFIDINSFNNLLIVSTYAYECSSSCRLYHLDEDIKKETKSIIDSSINSNEIRFRFNNIFLCKNATFEAIKNVNIRSFNYMHFMGHFYHQDYTGICLSRNSTDSYRDVDLVSIDKFIRLLTRKLRRQKFKMMFFSSCYSAGGNDFDNVTNIAFEIVRRNISDYVIGCYNAANSRSLPEISKLFYDEIIANEGNIEKSYIGMLKKIYNDSKFKQKGCIPRLYKAV